MMIFSYCLVNRPSSAKDDLFGPLLLFVQADPELDRVFGLSLLLEYWVVMRFAWHVE